MECYDPIVARDMRIGGIYKPLGDRCEELRYFNKTEHAFIYYGAIKDEDCVYFKVGSSCHPYIRMHDLGLSVDFNSGLPFSSIKVNPVYRFDIEHAVHETLNRYRKFGEYYLIPEELNPEVIIVHAIYQSIMEADNV